MSSLLNNLGPRYSRRNGTTPIILGFLLLIIGIAVVTYFITRDDKGDKDKKEDDDGETVPSIGDLTIKRTFNPDSSNSSESGTETYEIGGGKTETYQIEYNTGISDTELSKNVTIDITWNNMNGFDDVWKLEIEHYVDTVKKDTEQIFRYQMDTNGEKTNTVNSDFVNYFTNYATGLTKNFTGDGTYKFVGINTIAIKAYYRETSTYLYEGNKSSKADDIIVITSDDLAATLDLTAAVSRVYSPYQNRSGFTKAKDIRNVSYYARTLTDIDIYKSIYGIHAYPKSFTLMRTDDNINDTDFYFKFSDDEYLSYDTTTKKLSTSETKAGASIITLFTSSNNDDDMFRLGIADTDSKLYYIVVDQGEGLLKEIPDIESESVYETLEWKITTEPSRTDTRPRDEYNPNSMVWPDTIEMYAGSYMKSYNYEYYFQKYDGGSNSGFINYKLMRNQHSINPAKLITMKDCHKIKVKIEDNTWHTASEEKQDCGDDKNGGGIMSKPIETKNGTIKSAKSKGDQWEFVKPKMPLLERTFGGGDYSQRSSTVSTPTAVM